jgi:hypothetical protein
MYTVQSTEYISTIQSPLLRAYKRTYKYYSLTASPSSSSAVTSSPPIASSRPLDFTQRDKYAALIDKHAKQVPGAISGDRRRAHVGVHRLLPAERLLPHRPCIYTRQGRQSLHTILLNDDPATAAQNEGDAPKKAAEPPKTPRTTQVGIEFAAKLESTEALVLFTVIDAYDLSARSARITGRLFFV